MNVFVKYQFQKLNFILGRNPRFLKTENPQRFIPENYKAVVIISADFELAWAWRYSKSSKDPLAKSLHMARQERENLPKILDLCEKYNIPITWLTVGHLFLNSCSKENGIAHSTLPRIGNFENVFWKFSGSDWFEYDPCSDFRKDPLWYCPDLIEKITASKVEHEIGCHTFSHIDCRDEVCSPEVFQAEINASQTAAQILGIMKMTSFVHPGHTIGNLETLASAGYKSFRTDNANILGYPVKHPSGLWEFSTTLEIDYNPNWSLDWQIKRYIKTFKRAIHKNALCYLWFHPSMNPTVIDQILPIIFEWLNLNRKKIWITNTKYYVNWLNENL